MLFLSLRIFASRGCLKLHFNLKNNWYLMQFMNKSIENRDYMHENLSNYQLPSMFTTVRHSWPYISNRITLYIYKHSKKMQKLLILNEVVQKPISSEVGCGSKSLFLEQSKEQTNQQAKNRIDRKLSCFDNKL